MRITFEVAGLEIALEAEPKEIVEVLKVMGCEMPKAPAVKVSAHRVPEGAREELINGVWCLFYDDAAGRPSVAAAHEGRWDVWLERYFDREDHFNLSATDIDYGTDGAIVGDWVRSVWEAEK